MFYSTAYAQVNRAAQQTGEATQTGVSSFFSEFFGALPLWVAAAVVLVLSFFLANFVKKMVSYRLAKNQEMHQEVLILVERTVYTATIVLGMIISFRIVEIDLATLFGFMGIGIGLAFKDLLANFIAGVMILTQKKFKIGDLVSVEDKVGKIIEIDARTTQIRSFDGTNLIIPNSMMLNAVVENYTAESFRRTNFIVGVHYNTPLDVATNTIVASLQKNQSVMPNPAPQVWVTEFADSSINFDVKFWVESTAPRFEVKSQVMKQLKQDFDAAGIEIPFPIRTLALEGQDQNLMKALHLPTQMNHATLAK